MEGVRGEAHHPGRIPSIKPRPRTDSVTRAPEFWCLPLVLAVAPQAEGQMPRGQVTLWKLLEPLEFALRQRHHYVTLTLPTAYYGSVIALSHTLSLCAERLESLGGLVTGPEVM